MVLPGRDLHGPSAAGDARPQTSHCGTCTRLHRRLPDGRDRRAVRARCAALHLVSHDRASGQHSRGVASADRQSRLRLRRLPALLPVEPLRAGRGRTRLRRAQRPRRRRPRRAVRVDGSASSARGCEGSAIRRIGYERWSRNLAVGLGNAPDSAEVVAALEARADDPSPLVREHVGVGARAAPRKSAVTPGD